MENFAGKQPKSCSRLKNDCGCMRARTMGQSRRRELQKCGTGVEGGGGLQVQQWEWGEGGRSGAGRQKYLASPLVPNCTRLSQGGQRKIREAPLKKSPALFGHCQICDCMLVIQSTVGKMNLCQPLDQPSCQFVHILASVLPSLTYRKSLKSDNDGCYGSLFVRYR